MNFLSQPLKRRATRQQQVGVALIEVMVSLLIFSLAVLGLVAMQSKAINYAVSSEDRSRAALLADEIVTTMWLEGTASLSQSTKDAWTSRVQNATVSGLPNASANVSAPDATTHITTVTITWQPPSKTSTETSKYVTQVVIP
jgi:type IV pilus assembly protein PilV